MNEDNKMYQLMIPYTIYCGKSKATDCQKGRREVYSLSNIQIYPLQVLYIGL
jgi:hypothetical protein